MEVDSYSSPSSSSSSRLRGASELTPAVFHYHHKPSKMSKRERSPEGTDAGADRPSKRAAGITTSSLRIQQPDDWVDQAGGLSIDSPSGANSMFSGVSQGIGIAGPGPSTSAQMDEDFAMEDMSGAPPLREEERHENPSSRQQTSNPHASQLFLPNRSQSLPNPSLSNLRHPYGHQWIQQRVRDAEASPLVNVVPATPAASQQSLSMTEASMASSQNQLLHAHNSPSGTPPPSDPTEMSISTPPLVQQDLLPSVHPFGRNKRVAFGPRLDCEKCRQGEVHFAHVHYE